VQSWTLDPSSFDFRRSELLSVKRYIEVLRRESIWVGALPACPDGASPLVIA
jgi:hypothetical protein